MTLTKAVTITALFLLSLLPPSLSVGSSSTLSIIPSTSTVCAISSGDSPHSILCTSLTNPSLFPIFPNASFLSLSGGGSSFCALRPDSLTFLCFNSPSFSPKRVHTGSESISDLSLGSVHVSALLRTGSVRFWRAGPAFPISVPGRFSSLTSGSDFTCAIRAGTRKVECWGNGGDRIQSGFANETMRKLVAGDSHACGENTAGVLICTNRVFASSAETFRFAALALGGEHGCGIERARNSTVVCWGGDGVEYRPVGDTSVEILVAGGNLTCGVTTGNLSVVCWVADPSNPMVTMLPFPKVLPGVCVKEEDQDRVCACGIVTDSKNFCSGSGVICEKACPDPSKLPPPPLPQPSSRKKTSIWWWVFAVIGGVGSLIGVCSVIYCMWNGFCRQNKVYNSVQPTIAAANGNGGSIANVGSNNSGVVPSPRVSHSGSKSRIFRRQSSRAVMNRQRSGPSSFKDRAEQFSFSDLAAATKNFSVENKIGAGSFGTVYKGKLPDGREVAIKRSETSLKTKKLQEKESAFQSELSFLCRVHHKHLVGLVGYCDEREERLLVYEYMKNGALYDHLHSKSHQNSTVLNSWKMRIKVLLDASRGIEYLHNYAVPPIIHRDIKSSNILLDSNWVARVSDFGLSLLEPTTTSNKHLSMKAAGTLGYMDPEYYGLHHLTVKSDVYGLGVVMLEVLTGKRAIFKSEDSEGRGSPVSVVDYAIPCIVKGEVPMVLDPRVGPPGGHNAEAVELVAYTAVHCVSLEGKEMPTVEASLNAMEGILNEDELRSDPAYFSYYYSNVNLNPRLPPPIVSKEDWRFYQRKSWFDSKKEENEKVEWVDMEGDGLIGLSLGRQKSFANIFQDDRNRSNHIVGPPSRPSSRNAFNDGIKRLRSSEVHLALHDDIGSVDSLRPGSKVQSVIGAQNNSIPASQTFASGLGSSLSRSDTPDPQLVARAPTPSLPPVGVRLSNSEKNNGNRSNSFNRTSAGLVESDDLVAALSGMSLSTVGPTDEDIIAQSKLQKEIEEHQKFLFGMEGGQNLVKQNHFSKTSERAYSNRLSISQSTRTSYMDLARNSRGLGDLGNSMPRPNGQIELSRPTHSPANLHAKAPSGSLVGSPGCSPAHYQNFNSANAAFTSYGLSGFSTDTASPSMLANHIGMGSFPLFENTAAASPTAIHGMDSMALGGFSLGQTLTGAVDLQNFNKIGNHTAGAAHQMPLVDPLYAQNLRSAEYLAGNYNDLSTDRGYMGNSYLDLLEIQKQYLGALLQPQKQSGMPFLGKSGGLNNGYYGNPSFGLGMMYPGSPVLPASPGGPGSPLWLGDRSLHFASGVINLAGGAMGSWHSDTGGNMNGSFASSLLEEFKSNKTKNYELSNIAGHVVEFSADQYGSRFIQQKLETATAEEKDMVYDEIIPHAFSLMTDVFGNYVIQKFFEHGSAAQRRELADQLTGHVLTLTLQMYGCRVIQKAIEVVDLDQQTKMVAELDGHVMRCVRDQNGNHVIQKCIECIPEDAIQFIVSSFYDQVVLLSTHPYGCRVIQRVLEHCHDATTQQIMMDGIFQSVCMLAQDQYGNYVVQHVLEHGKPHERSAIIKKLAGQIVQMSQQKFASNVVEKCLTFGGPVERQILVNEMLGTTDENEPLQAMMKDQFANYVVQKVLETCDDQQRELILSRIKVHLNALKKYTYGKHIVARVEKLVAAGERRIGLQSSYNA